MTEFIWFKSEIFKQFFLGGIRVAIVHLDLIGQALGFGQALYKKGSLKEVSEIKYSDGDK